MPRFFFHVVNGEFLPDHDGSDFANEEEAKSQAAKAAGAMINEQGMAIWKTGHWDMFVCDENNKTHLKLSFTAEDLTNRHR